MDQHQVDAAGARWVAPILLRRLYGFALAIFAALPFIAMAEATPDKWSVEIDRFTTADAKKPPPQGVVVFVGSSSIAAWTTLATDFPGIKSINRGFGGSELADVVFYADRIVIPYHPRLVVLYAGENDLWDGKTPRTRPSCSEMTCTSLPLAMRSGLRSSHPT